MRLDGETAFITGAGAGIGEAAAELFAAEGAHVIATDVDGDAAAETAADICADGGNASAEQLDVRDAEAVETAVDAAVDTHGLDVILNNAGVGHERGPTEDLDHDTLERVFEINVKGVWNGCRAAIPHFRAQGHGRIVNTASVAGIVGFPDLSAYSLSKGAVVNYTRAVAAEAGPDGIRANALCPGVTDTALARRDADAETWESIKADLAEAYPLRRLGEPEEVARSMLYLGSEDSAWVTGHALVVDGGFSCA